MLIRNATLADVPAVHALLVETWHATYDDILGPKTVASITNDWHAPEVLEGQINAAGSVFLVAVEARHLLATSAAHLQTPDMILLGRLYVAPSAQAHGVGSRLLKATLNSHIFRLATRARLEVEPRNITAIAFYTRNGFKACGETSHCGREGSNIKALIMEKSVEPALAR